MRRSIVSIPLLFALVAVAAVWLLGLTGSAAAAPRSAHIVCPASSTATPPTCCPLPPAPAGGQSARIVCCPPTAGGASQPQAQPICCGTTPCCTSTCCPTSGSPTCCTAPCGPGSVTIAVSPNPSLAGQKVVISGAVVGNSAAGTPVVLWRELAGQSSFQQAGQTTTDSSGQYKFTLPRGNVMVDQQWYVTSGGVQSPTVQQHVDALVGLTSSAGSTKAGRSIVLRGHVTPSHAGEVVLVQMSRGGGAWHVIARPRLGRGSSYTVSHRFAQAGALKLRVVLGADHRNDRSVSRTVMLKVTR